MSAVFRDDHSELIQTRRHLNDVRSVRLSLSLTGIVLTLSTTFGWLILMHLLSETCIPIHTVIAWCYLFIYSYTHAHTSTKMHIQSIIPLKVERVQRRQDGRHDDEAKSSRP